MNPREALRDLADDARDYADADRAIRTAERRRTVRWGVAAVVAIVVIIVLLPARQTRQAEPVTPPPPPRAHSLYSACRNACATLLRTTDGRETEIGFDTVHPPGNLTLSPDGRWLGLTVTGGGYELRDLLGGTVHRIPAEPGGAYTPWVWSADSRRLILGHHRDGDISHFLGVDLTTGTTGRPAVPEGAEIVGLTGGNDLILLSPQKITRRVTLDVAGRSVDFRAPDAYVRENHGFVVQSLGDRIYLHNYGGDTGDEITVLEYALDGRLVSSLPIPDGRWPVGPTPTGYVVVEPGRQQRLYRGAELFGTYPEMAGVVIPGLGRF
ncbi:hypothetical protein [Herbidospora sp. RD11066]